MTASTRTLATADRLGSRASGAIGYASACGARIDQRRPLRASDDPAALGTEFRTGHGRDDFVLIISVRVGASTAPGEMSGTLSLRGGQGAGAERV